MQTQLSLLSPSVLAERFLQDLPGHRLTWVGSLEGLPVQVWIPPPLMVETEALSSDKTARGVEPWPPSRLRAPEQATMTCSACDCLLWGTPSGHLLVVSLSLLIRYNPLVAPSPDFPGGLWSEQKGKCACSFCVPKRSEKSGIQSLFFFVHGVLHLPEIKTL